MKKLLSVLICLLVVFALAAPVFAASTAQMTVTASKTELKPGEKATFTVSVSQVENCKFGGFMFQFDESVFSYEKGKSLAGLSGFMAGVTNAAGKIAGFFMNGKETIEGDLFSITLKVREDAQPGTYRVSGKPSLNDMTCDVVEAEITVTAATVPDKTKPTTPTVVVPTIPTPTLPVMQELPVTQEPPVSAVTPDTEPVPEDTGPLIDTTFPTEENRHFEETLPEKPAFPWWIVAVIGLVAVGGVVFLILEIRKTKKEQ